MGSFGQRLRRERGAVAVEFALIMPVLFLILFGTLEFGRAWSQVQVFNGAAREGARCSAVLASKVTTCTVVTSDFSNRMIEDAWLRIGPTLAIPATSVLTLRKRPIRPVGGASRTTASYDVCEPFAARADRPGAPRRVAS